MSKLKIRKKPRKQKKQGLTIRDNWIRRKIDKILCNYPTNDWINHLSSKVELIGPADPEEDCESYAFGAVGCRQQIKHQFPDIKNPQKQDIVLYCDKYGFVGHVGIYQPDGSVISKWGEGPVLNHPMKYIGSVYGDNVLFRRLTPEDFKLIRTKKYGQ